MFFFPKCLLDIRRKRADSSHSQEVLSGLHIFGEQQPADSVGEFLGRPEKFANFDCKEVLDRPGATLDKYSVSLGGDVPRCPS